MRVLLRLSLSCKLLVGLTILAFLFSAGPAYADKELKKVMKHLAKKCEKKYTKSSQKCMDASKSKEWELKCIDKAQKKLDACINPKAIMDKAKNMDKETKKQILKFEKAVDHCQAKNDHCVDKCVKKFKDENPQQKCLKKCTHKQEQCINKMIKKFSK